jgi:dienelactone hydrolase
MRIDLVDSEPLGILSTRAPRPVESRARRSLSPGPGTFGYDGAAMKQRGAFSMWLVLAACAASMAVQARTALQDPPKPPADPKSTAAESRPDVPTPETLTRDLADSVVMTADVYRRPKSAAGDPVLVCMHQAGGSRGEYRPVVARLMELGFDVFAPDLRSGGAGDHRDPTTGKRVGVPNGTWASAKKLSGHEASFLEAYPDVDAAVAWARELFPRSKIGLVGSSYSSTLALVFTAEHPERVDAVFAFSPGDYIDEWSPVKERIKTLARPAYITCGSARGEVDKARPIADAIVDRKQLLAFWPGEEGAVGAHGSAALSVPDDASRARQWSMFEKALDALRAPKK